MPSASLTAAASASSALSSGSSTLPRWQVALLVASPVALGVGAYLYYRRRGSGSSGARSQGQGVTGPAVTQLQQQHDLDTSDDSQLSASERAMCEKVRGNEYFKAGQYASALRHYTAAIALCPPRLPAELAVYYQNRAAAHEMMGNFGECAADCDRAIDLNARYSKALQRRARANEQLLLLRPALADITAVCILDGFQNQPALAMADRVLRQHAEILARERLKSASSVLPSAQSIQSFLQSFVEDPVAAEILSSSLTSATPTVANGTAAAAEAAEANGHTTSDGWQRAVDAVREGRMADVVDLCTAYLNECRSSCDTTATTTATATVTTTSTTTADSKATTADATTVADDTTTTAAAVTTNGSSGHSTGGLCADQQQEADGEDSVVKALLLRATFLMLAGQQKEAQCDLEQVISHPQASTKLKINALIKRATCRIDQDSSDQAKQLALFNRDMERALALDANNCDIYFHRGQVRLTLGDVEPACADFRRVEALCAHSPLASAQLAHIELGLAAASQNSSALAAGERQFASLLRRYPASAELRTLYSQALCELQRFSEADEQLQAALALEPRQAALLVNRGHLLLQWKGDVDTATELMTRALQCDSRCDIAHESLGMIQLKSGNLERGIEHFDAALSLTNKMADLQRLFCFREAASVQQQVSTSLGISQQQLQQLQQALG